MDSLIITLIQQIVPANILESFTIESIDDSKSELLVILLVEKEDLFPVEEDLVLNGYLNIVFKLPHNIPTRSWRSYYLRFSILEKQRFQQGRQ